MVFALGIALRFSAHFSLRTWKYGMLRCMLLFALCRVVALGQDARTECLPAPGAHFIRAADSLAALREFARLDSLVAELASDMSEDRIRKYAEACERQLLHVVSAVRDSAHPLYIEALSCHAEALWLVDRDASTRELEQAVRLLARLPDCRSAWSARVTGNLAYQLFELDRIDESIRGFERCIATLTALAEPPPSFTASQYLFLGLAWRRSLRHADAERAFAAAAAWQLRAGDSIRAAEALSWLGDALYRQHRFEQAEEQYQRGISLLRRASGAQSEQTLSALQELATFHMFLARYNDAYRLLAEVLDAVNRPGASYDPILVFFAYSSTAQVCADLGRDAEAEQYFAEARHRADAIAESDRPMYKAMVTNNTASFLANRERYDEASALVEDAMRLMDASGWKDVGQFKARAASNLASMYSELHRLAEAETLLVGAIEMYEKTFGAQSPELAAPVSNLGMVYRDMGRLDEAERCIQRALLLARAAHGEAHPLSARLLRNLASVELARGQISRALDLGCEAVKELRRWYDPWHVEMLDGLQLIARCYEAGASGGDVVANMRELLSGTVRRLRDSFDFESEARQLQLLERFAERNLGVIARWALRDDAPPEAAELLFDAAVQLRGEVLAEQARMQRALRGRESEARLAEALHDTRERYAALGGKAPSEELAALRAQLLTRIDSLDALLRRSSANYDRGSTARDAGWRDIQRLLRRDELLVHYLIVPSGYSDSTRVVLAVLLRADSAPRVLRLCEESALERAMLAPVGGSMPSLLPQGDRMRRIATSIWDPILRTDSSFTRAIIIPDGVLHRVAFAALQPTFANPAEVVLDELVELRQLVSAKDILQRSPGFRLRTAESATRCVLVGNPEFGAALASSARVWTALPGTAEEVRRIAALCGEYAIPARTLTAKEAGEREVKQLSGERTRILHIATHGFFFPAPRERATAITSGMEATRGRDAFRAERHPLLRSGLILAGANAAWTGAPVPPADEDGILTALEISRLDCASCEVVTLSACETALGDISTGDGVFGLQRSFFIAGARALLMSLWNVSDAATVELMDAFYRAWFGGADKVEALRAARRQLRSRHADPAVWAPFILIGE